MMLALLCCVSSAMAAKDKCIMWGYKWDGMADYQYTYTWLYTDGSFETDEGFEGYWEKFGGSFLLQYTDGCEPLYAGTKKQGFFQCTDGTGEEGTNYYIIKGANKKLCEEAMPILSAPEAQDGPSGCSPE